MASITSNLAMLVRFEAGGPAVNIKQNADSFKFSSSFSVECDIIMDNIICLEAMTWLIVVQDAIFLLLTVNTWIWKIP